MWYTTNIALSATHSAMLHIYLFGHLRLILDGQALRLAALPRTALLWAYLLLQRAEAIPRDHLAYLLWPDSSEAEARANLRRHLHDLRRALPPAPADRPWLLADATSVRWNPAADYWLDVAEFERLSIDPDRLAETVALYTGELLPNFYDDWVLAERERLSNLYAANLRRLVAQGRARGDLASALEYARRLLQHDPLREDAARELIALRYAAGDRSGALAEYQRFEQRLRAELGVAPMPETTALYQAIVGNTPLPGVSLPAAPLSLPAAISLATPEPAAGSGGSKPPSNLPSMITSFVGREQELAALHQLIGQPSSRARLVTLTGPGGTGKTRLSLEVAGRLLREAPQVFSDGVFFVALAAIRDPAFVAPAVAAALDVRESGSRPLTDSLKDYLYEKRLLLLFDNFEQVVDAAPLVAELLAAAPGLRVLVTSRALLQLYGEHEFPVPPLDLPPTNDERRTTNDERRTTTEDRGLKIEDSSVSAGENLSSILEPRSSNNSSVVGGQSSVVGQYAAVALFVERARAADPAFSLTDANAATVAEICIRLDGLPLAIELAAARSKLFEPQALLARLSSRLDFLATQARNLASRQQTLRATIDWSYNLLTVDEQALFARLAVFAGLFSLDAAEAVASELRIENEELKNIAHDQNLFNSQFSILNLLESLVNQSVVRQVGVDGSEGQPHFRLMLTLREYAWERLEQRGEAETIRRRHADFFLRLAEQAELELTGPRQQVWFARLTLQHDNLRAALAWSLERPVDGELERSIRLAGALARFWWMRGHVAEGRRWLAAALQQGGSPRDTAAHAKALNWAGILAWSQGDLAAARVLHEESLALQRALGNQRGIAHSLNNLGIVATKQGDFVTARALHEESLALRRALDDLVGIAASLTNLGEVVAQQGDYPDARAYLAESLALQRALGDQLAVAVALNHLGEVADRQGHDLEARALYEESLALERTLGYREGIAISLGGLGRVMMRQASYAVATDHYLECLALWAELGGKDGIAVCLEGMACVAAALGLDGRAARLFGAAEALRTAIGAPMSPADVSFVEPFLSLARVRLGAAEFSVAWKTGAALPLEQAISAALQQTTPT